MSDGVVIVGGSVAGTRVARALRENGYCAPVTVLEAERHAPYDKPPLSKASLSGAEFVPISLMTPTEAADLCIDLRLGVRAIRLDTDAAAVHTADGQVIRYAELVIATGVAARPSPWDYPDGVHVLRTLDDAAAVHDSLDRGGDMVIIGAGFIGSEISSVARQRGLQVTLVDPLPVPMARLLGEDIGRRLAELHQRHGVDTRFGVGVDSIERAGRELHVQLGDGSMLRAASVVVGIGTVLNTGWLEDSGLLIDDGVVCDQYGLAIGHRNVYSAGDTAQWFHPRHGASVRTEHWTNAIEQAACVAWNITNRDKPRPHEPVEYVWSDQHDWKMHILGRPDPLSPPTVIDETDTGRLAAFWTAENDTVTGGFTVNWSKASVMLRRAIPAGVTGRDLSCRLEPVEGVGK